MDSKPKRQLTDQQRANLAAGREKLKTLRADPDYSKAQKERREERKRERSEAAAAGPTRESPRRQRLSDESASASASGRSNVDGYASSVPSMRQ